jgi:hypothetical protein
MVNGRRSVLILAAAAMLASCVPEDPPTFRAARNWELWPDITGCPDLGCGSNAATVGDGFVFDGLDARGLEPSPGGVKVDGATFRGARVNIRVDGHELKVVSPDDEQLTFSGQVLVNDLVIGLSRPPRVTYELTLVQLLTTRFWADPRGVEIPLYKFFFRRTGPVVNGSCQNEDFELPCGAAVPLCKGNRLDTDEIEYTALVFRGDRYNTVAKTVSAAAPDDGWFNLACAGTAMAKMHLLRHTAAGGLTHGAETHPTTIPQRQAMLKMLTADYCGDGRSFTVNGHPLVYGDVRGWYPWAPRPPLDLEDPAQVASFEAIWTENGAVCLDQPRAFPAFAIQDHCRQARRNTALSSRLQPADGLALSRGSELAIRADPIPPCGNTRHWSKRGYAVSANPR